MIANFSVRLGVSFTLCAISFATALTAHASTAHHLLFSDIGAVQDALPKGHAVGDQFPAKRVRTVEISATLSRPDLLAEGNQLTLNLFEDTGYTAVVDRVHVNVNGTVAVRARILDAPLGFVLLSTTHGRTLGSVMIPEAGEHFHIQSGPDGKTHYLLDLDAAAHAAAVQECLCCSGEPAIPLIPPTGKSEDVVLRGDILSEDPLNLAAVDVMIVYTPAAREWADANGGGIENVVSQSMELAHLTLSNSNTRIAMPLVHSAEIEYTESSCMHIDLNRLSRTPSAGTGTGICDGVQVPLHGFMEEVHDWRDQYGADLVALFTVDSNFGGMAYYSVFDYAFIGGGLEGWPEYGFSISSVLWVATYISHIHELGHNLGAGHHKGQNASSGPGALPYAAGWRWFGDDGHPYASVMTYWSGTYFEDGVNHFNVAHFSDPAIDHRGVSTGHPEDGNNARMLRESKHIVAAYRPSIYDHAILFDTHNGGEFSVIQGDAMQFISTGDSTTPVTASSPSSWPLIHWTLDDVPFSQYETIVIDNVDRHMLATAHFQTPQTLHTRWDGISVTFGAMFDLEVTQPVFVTGFGVHLTNTGTLNNFEVYLREGTSFGAESSSEGWVLASRVEGVVSRGFNQPSHVDSGNMLLLPSQTYGIYLHLDGAFDDFTGPRIRFSSGGPTEYASSEMTLTTNCAKSGAPFTSGTSFPREWNGTVYFHTIEPPEATQIVPTELGPTNAGSVEFAVTFSGGVFNFHDESNLIITHQGTAHTNADITGSGDSYIVTLDGITGDGSFTLAIDTNSGIEDIAGQALVASVTSLPVIIDNTPPVITLEGDNPLFWEAGTTPFVDPGATASDTLDGDLTDDIVVSGAVDPNVLDHYALEYNVSDAAGNVATQVTRMVTVADTTPPTITRIGPASVTVEAGLPYADLGATAFDSFAGDLTGQIVVSNPVDTSELGAYMVRYNVSDPSGNAAAEVTRMVTVVDTTPPVITRIGPASVTAEAGLPYADLGATAFDSFAGDLTGQIVVSNPVDTSELGAYTVRYNVSDPSGNAAAEVMRMVTVEDTTPPVIMLNGDPAITIERGSSFDDPGATATDSFEGDLTANIEVTGSVNTSEVGVYTLQYNVSDSSGNEALEAIRTVTVEDTVPPNAIAITPDQLGPTNASSIAFAVTFDEPVINFNAPVDVLINHDGTANDGVSIEGGPVEYTVTVTGIHGDGTFTVAVDTGSGVQDPSGNSLASSVTSQPVIIDNTPPVITLEGDNPLFWEAGTTPFVDPGATASDTLDGDLTGDIVVSGAVNPNTLDDYALEYNVSDTAGNVATQVIRTVTVVDSTPPIIMLNGDPAITIERGGSFDDPGATATDSFEGDLTANIVVTGSVNATEAGVYTIQYNVSDSSGNEAVEVIRTVTVEDTVPPNAIAITPGQLGPTNASSIGFVVTFDEPVINFNAPVDVLINHDGTANDGVSIEGGPVEYTVTVTGIHGDGTFTVAVNTESGVQDPSGNSLATSVTSEPVVIDSTPPVVVELQPETTGPTNDSTIAFAVLFSEPVNGIDAETDLIVTHDGTAHTSLSVSGSGSEFSVLMSGITGDGTLTISITESGGIIDLAGNALSESIASAPVMIDNTPPAPPVILTDFGNGPGEGFMTSISSFPLEGTTDLDALEVWINGNLIDYSPGSTAWSTLLDLVSLGPVVNLTVVAVDAAGNESEPTSITISYDPLNDADGNGLTDQEEWDIRDVIPTDPLDPLLPRVDWFVSAASGNDLPAIDGGGTPLSPWRTIGFAMEQLAPLAREHFPLRVLLDDAINFNDAGGAVALYEEYDLAFIPFVTVEPEDPAGALIHVRPTTTGTTPVIRAAANSTLRGVVVRPALATDQARALLKIDNVPFTVVGVTFDGMSRQDSIGIDISGFDSSDSFIAHSQFLNLGTGIRSINSAAAVSDNSFDDIAANSSSSVAIAIGFTVLPAKQSYNETPVLGRVDRILETGFNRFRGLPAGAHAIEFFDTPIGITSAQYNDWGVYTEEEIRALITAPHGGSDITVDILPFLSADKPLEPGSLTGVILDSSSQHPIALPLGPGAETSDGAFQMADTTGIFQWPFGDLAHSSHSISARAFGYDDSEPSLVTIGPGRIPVLRFLLQKQGSPVLSASPQHIQVDGAGGSGTVTVSNAGTGTLHWDANTVTGGEWLALKKQDNTLIVTASTNTVQSLRNGLVRITSANAANSSIDITIQQDVDAARADINRDGVINAIDVQLVINAALGISSEYDADINGDGVVNAVDVQLVINAALGIEIDL